MVELFGLRDKLNGCYHVNKIRTSPDGAFAPRKLQKAHQLNRNWFDYN